MQTQYHFEGAECEFEEFAEIFLNVFYRFDGLKCHRLLDI